MLINNEPETRQVLKDSTAFLLTDAMADSMKANRKFARSGVSINSTSTRAALSGMSAAGKSGTTTGNNDIWFVGFTPYYTAGVWGGCDSNQKLSAGNGGTSFHKDIWRNIMNRVHEGLSDPGISRSRQRGNGRNLPQIRQTGSTRRLRSRPKRQRRIYGILC